MAETIQICADTLYDGDLLPPQFSKEIFIELMNIATTSAEFSFSNVMYKQVNGVAISSPLGPALANIFVGCYENKLFQTINKPFFYTRYADDTFSIFRTELIHRSPFPSQVTLALNPEESETKMFDSKTVFFKTTQI